MSNESSRSTGVSACAAAGCAIKAITAAIQSAEEGDTVIIAGKGHETYQEIMGIRTHFDDREVVLSILDQTETM